MPACARLGYHGNVDRLYSGRGVWPDSGYLGGWWDEIVSFVSNVLMSFPVMVLFILILNYLGQSGFNIVVAVTTLGPGNHADRPRFDPGRQDQGLHPCGSNAR